MDDFTLPRSGRRTDRPGAPADVVEAYSLHFRAGMLDLSAPSPTPLPLDLGSEALAGVDLGYSMPGGSRLLREAVAARYETLGPDDILITSGGSEALAALAAAVGGPRRRIALGTGAYASFVEVARCAGASLVPWTGAADGVDAVVATNPTVPDGRRVDVPALLDAARRAGAVAIVDEVYRWVALRGEPPRAAADLDPCAVSVGDLTKPLGLGGLRIGWIATRNAAVRAAAARWLSLLTGGPSALSEAAALEAMASFDARVEQHTADARANAPAVYEVLRGAGWTFDRPELGLTLCATPPRPLTGADFARLASRGMFAVRGEAFGRPGTVRIGLLTPPDRLRAGLQVLAAPRTDVLAVLMRVPRPGFGKSRLAATLGVDDTHRIARAFAEDTGRLATSGEWRTVAAFTPAHEADAARALLPGAQVLPQVEGDLGARILGALDAALVEGTRAVLIGSDTPDLPSRVIDAAFAALDEADVVIAPARDGGFVLLGVTSTDAALFEGVEWSTETVCARVVENARRLRRRVVLLESWEDVDDVASLAALARRVEGTDRAPATRAALAATGITARPQG
ncbi:MAG: TIGR04282 family arsenosugar biosynthesis glycosyltransferase [Dehalococcoidia bacterium]